MQTAERPVATFAELWNRTARLFPLRPFLVFQADDGTVDQWSYSEFDRVVRDMAQRLSTAGVQEGTGIHLCLRNCPVFVAIWLAAAQLGAWINPVDPTTSEAELQDQFTRTGVRLGVCTSDRASDYRAAARAAHLPVLEFQGTASDVASLSMTGCTETIDVVRTPGPRPTDRLAVMFTSGTTSKPKGVVLTQRNYRVVAQEMAAAARLTAADRWLVTLPLFHGNAQYYCFSSAIEVGASVAMTERFSASRWVEQAIDLSATVASLFAAPIRMILARTPENQAPAELRHVWFAQNLGRQHHADFGRLVGTLPRQLYGMTETVAVVSTDQSIPARADIIGVPLNGREVKLVEPGTLNTVTTGTPGMIAVRGVPGDDLFLEYLDAPEATGQTLITDMNDQTWLLTGDLATANANGELTFVGRVDDVIKVSGENVSLAGLEATIAEAPGVLEAAVLGEIDPIRDHVPVAYVVAKPDTELDVSALQRWASERLTKAARPVQWHIIDELPRSSVGKIRRFKLNPTPNTTSHGGQ